MPQSLQRLAHSFVAVVLTDRKDCIALIVFERKCIVGQAMVSSLCNRTTNARLNVVL